MKSRRVWMLPVLLLLCGTVGCRERPEPVVEEPKAVVSKPDVTEEPRPVRKKPEVTEWQLPPDAPQPVIAPFDADQAKQYQESWAEYLGAPAEITNEIGVKLRLIPAGEFMMGSPEWEERRGDDEYQHRVRITKPFYLGVYEVTQAEYERLMGTNPSEFSEIGGRSKHLKDADASRFPVDSVSWDDAMEFCRKLSDLADEKTAGRGYRLPTEAEWEYACRAGTTTPFLYGSESNGSQANCDGGYPYGTTMEGPDLKRTTTVGSYAPNAFGLYDMHGNVGEWCRDRYGENYYQNSPVDDPQGPSDAPDRVFRGGAWIRGDVACRSACRFLSEPEFGDCYLGFRVAADPPNPSVR